MKWGNEKSGLFDEFLDWKKPENRQKTDNRQKKSRTVNYFRHSGYGFNLLVLFRLDSLV